MIEISGFDAEDWDCLGWKRADPNPFDLDQLLPTRPEDRFGPLMRTHAPAPPAPPAPPPPQRHRAPVLPPAALNREDAAAYVSLSGNGFDDAVKAGVMPQPRTHGRRLIWIRAELDAALLQMPIRGQSANPSHQDDAGPLADWM
jgi:predicted DNA-binding transcriptional regulator AlpA